LAGDSEETEAAQAALEVAIMRAEIDLVGRSRPNLSFKRIV
jgi:hypothetical protein